jgi:ribonuclease Y
MTIVHIIIISVISAVLAGIAGFFLRKIISEKKVGSAKTIAKKILTEAEKEAENKKREGELEAKEELHKARLKFENESRDRRHELLTLERRVMQREENLDRKVDILDKKESELSKKEHFVNNKAVQLTEKEKQYNILIEEERQKLQQISGLTKEEAKQQLFTKYEEEVIKEAGLMARRIEEEAKENAEKKAKYTISLAIQRIASEYVGEATVTTVSLPNDEMKGRIIGREGRNIRALEAATGIDIIIDDTPEVVTLSGYDPVRREIAKISLERLIIDGRIHPARIEEIVEKVKKEMDETIKEIGQQTVFELGLHNMHPELIKLIGRLHYRTSYGQNVLMHSKESAHLMGIMMAELGFNNEITIAKRAGILHDIGKAVDQEMEGTHVSIGADLAKKYGESAEVIHAIKAHHGDEEPKTILAILCAAADAISASRPGARSESIEAYIKRLEKLEQIAKSFKGVSNCYAIQAGREIRVIVQPDKVDDNETIMLARNITKKIQDEMEYPGQIKVTVLRETRAVEYAK